MCLLLLLAVAVYYFHHFHLRMSISSVRPTLLAPHLSLNQFDYRLLFTLSLYTSSDWICCKHNNSTTKFPLSSFWLSIVPSVFGSSLSTEMSLFVLL